MRIKKKNRTLTKESQLLRKGMTKEEKHLWYDFLKSLPVTVNRQKVIDFCIVDFYCAKANIVIEIDSTLNNEKDLCQKNKLRDEYLLSKGIKVLRYTELDVNEHFEEVCEDILKYIMTPEEIYTDDTSNSNIW